MNDNKQQQHEDDRRASDYKQAAALLTDVMAGRKQGTAIGVIFSEAGLTIGTHAVIIGAIMRQHNLELSKDVVDALADSMMVGIELARRAGLKRDSAN